MEAETAACSFQCIPGRRIEGAEYTAWGRCLMTDDYEYKGLMAQAWDLLRGETSAWPDRVFYRQLIELRPGPVLDVGCGTGRLTPRLSGAGDWTSTASTSSPEMLAICRDKAAAAGIDVAGRLFEQAMGPVGLAPAIRDDPGAHLRRSSC